MVRETNSLLLTRSQPGSSLVEPIAILMAFLKTAFEHVAEATNLLHLQQCMALQSMALGSRAEIKLFPELINLTEHNIEFRIFGFRRSAVWLAENHCEGSVK